MRYVRRFRTVADARASEPVSPATVSVDDGSLSKTMLCNTGTAGEKLRVVGADFAELMITKKSDFSNDCSMDF